MPDILMKYVPAEMLTQLKAQAKKNHRSLQGELMIVLERAVRFTRPSLEEVHLRITELGLTSGPESVEIIREDRDAH